MPIHRTAVLIPARWASQRLPGKMLLPLKGKPLIQWTYENACNAFGREAVWILTDHIPIYKAAQEFGAQVVMTPQTCENGSARSQWALTHDLQSLQAEYIVGLQGDEPLLPSAAMQMTLQALQDNPHADLSTLTTPLDEADFDNPSAVKCVCDIKGRALYFSRSPIPNPGWHKQRYEMPSCAKRHIGLYIWRREFLEKCIDLPASSLQSCEDLEQLRILEAGHAIQVAFWPETLPPGVDTQEDLTRVETLLQMKSS